MRTMPPNRGVKIFVIAGSLIMSTLIMSSESRPLISCTSTPSTINTGILIECQREIARTIIERGADYILALKGNQPEMLDRVSGSFTYIKPASEHTMEGKAHRREETRVCSVITNLDNIIDRDRWPGLKSIVRIESRTRGVKSGQIHKGTRYYLSSLDADAQHINHSIRTHWSVENQLHWTLDVAFGDDASRKRKDNAAQNFSLLNRIGLNIIKNAKVSSIGVRGHRKKAGWDNDYLLYALKSFDVVKN